MMAQPSSHSLLIKDFEASINIDGQLKESFWNLSDEVVLNEIVFPLNTESKPLRTQVKFRTKDNILYLGVTADIIEKPIVSSLKRDVNFFKEDVFMVIIDPNNNHKNGYSFGVNPKGVQFDAFLSENMNKRGETAKGVSTEWDYNWESKVQINGQKWTIEIAIPLNHLNYDPEETQWSFNFIRKDVKSNTEISWLPIPIQFSPLDLNFTKTIAWESKREILKSKIDFNPYVKYDYIKANQYNESGFDFGFNSQISFGKDLKLNLTLNPDFSNINVDDQVANFSQYDLLRAERRTFFTENNEVFDDFGHSEIRPFVSRRIGLDDNNKPNKIASGIRLSGLINPTVKIGFMNIYESKNEHQSAKNYSVLSFRKTLAENVFLKGYFMNNLSRQESKSLFSQSIQNTGFEFDYSSKNRIHRTKLAYGGGLKNNKIGGLGNFSYQYLTRKSKFDFSYNHVDDHYVNELSYIKRFKYVKNNSDGSERQIGFQDIQLAFERKIFIDHTRINAHQFSIDNQRIFYFYNHVSEQKTSLEYELQMKDGSEWEIEYSNESLSLLTSKSVGLESHIISPGKYKNDAIGFEYESPTTKQRQIELGINYGHFYLGRRLNLYSNLEFIITPKLNFDLLIDFNKIHFEEESKTGEQTLIQFNTEISLSKQLFVNTVFQYNTEENRFFVNSKVEWNYKPLSYLYLIFGEEKFKNKTINNKQFITLKWTHLFRI